MIVCCVFSGGQTAVTGFQRHAGRHHRSAAVRPANLTLLRHLPSHSRAVHGEKIILLKVVNSSRLII